MKLTQSAVLHVRFEGRSFDIPFIDLDVSNGSNDAMIKQALAEYLNVSKAKLRFYTIDRHETGNLTVRPEAVFG